MAGTSIVARSILLAIVACSCAGRSAPEPESAHGGAVAVKWVEKPRVAIDGLGCEVWGGDGEGLAAIWSEVLHVTVSNPTETDLHVTKVSWKVEQTQLESVAEPDVSIGPGEKRSITVSDHLTPDELERLRRYDCVDVTVEVSTGEAGGTLLATKRVVPGFC
jgi:hypothetical protein